MKKNSPLFDTSFFNMPSNIVHACAGGETLPLKTHAEYFQKYLDDKSNGMKGRISQENTVERVRSKVGALWNVEPSSIGFVSSVAEGVSILYESLSWNAEDNICIDANEYPSMVAPFSINSKNSPQIIIASGTDEDRLFNAVNNKTKIIVVSYVSYLNGERFNLKKLRSKADEVGAMLVVDFTQAAGYLPIEASLADFAFSSCYKWLLGITGCSIAFWNRERQPNWRPNTGGWHSIKAEKRPNYTKKLELRDDGLKFTRGNPSHASIYVLDGALEFLKQYHPQNIQQHVQSLTVELISQLQSHNIISSTPKDTERHGASVCIDGDFDYDFINNLQQSGIYIWGGTGRLRISFHGYNYFDEISKITDNLIPAIKNIKK